MPEIVVMPKLGLTAREGLLSAWLVELGQEVKEGDPLCEIETDKITNEVESPASGVLLKRIDADQVVPVGEPIGVIGQADEDVAGVILYEASPSADQAKGGSGERSGERHDQAGEARTVAESPISAGSDARPKISPLARRLVGELGVDLTTLTGSGPGGRITRQDVEKAAGRGAGAAGRVPGEAEEVREEPTRLRKAIAAAMSLSAQAPQFSLERDVDVTELLSRLRELGSEEAARPSVADAIGVATARAIRRHDVFLRRWEEGAFIRSTSVHLGVAVTVEDGLIVPVVRDADRLTVPEFAAIRRDLQERTASGKLSTAEATGAVFTISNLGTFGVDRFRALVNPPESGILAVGRLRGSGHRQELTLCLSADHRVVDGAQGARLLAEIDRQLEVASGIEELLAPVTW